MQDILRNPEINPNLNLKADLDHVVVSTVALLVEHGFGGQPNGMWYETMVFNDRSDMSELDVNRYATFDEAVKGHEEMCQKWQHKKGTKNFPPINILLSITNEMVESIIDCANYGTDYWARDLKHNGNNVRVLPHDEDTYSEGEIVEGIQRALNPNFKINPQLRGEIYNAIVSNDPGAIDPDCADVIIQAAVFGEIVYG